MYEQAEDPKVCKFCLSGGEEESRLISPCLCAGGSRYVHRHCLDEWRKNNMANAFYRCEICHYTYTYRRIWWSKLLESRYTIMLLTLGIMIASIVVFGSISARTTNLIYYWLMERSYQEPARLQKLIHGLTIVGVPGLLLLLRDLLSSGLGREVVNSSARNADRGAPFYYAPTIINTGTNNGNTTDDKKSNTDDKTTDKKKDKYEPPSTVIIIALLVGTAGSFKYTYDYFNRLAKRICAEAQDLVENIRD
jgi:hypothetical protein